MGSVGTVVVVGVKLRRVQRVGRLQLRWVGRTRRQRLFQLRQLRPILRGAICILRGACSSTHKTQTSPAAAIESVYVHSLAYPVRTKINPVSPVANHAPVVLSVTRLPPVVYLMLQVVRLVPMPVVQPQFVILVGVENTTIKLDKHRSQVAKTAIPDCTKTKLDKHRAEMIVPVIN